MSRPEPRPPCRRVSTARVVGYALGVRLTLLLALATLLPLLGGCVAGSAAGEQTAEPADAATDGLAPLARYPQSPALAATRDAYAEAAAGRGRDNVLMTTWFPGAGAEVGEWSTVDPRGKVSIYRFVHNVGFQDSRSTSLVQSQIPELASLLATLPPSAPPPTLDRLLIVGFPDAGGSWITRLYDRARPPDAVRRVFHQMTGAPLGTE